MRLLTICLGIAGIRPIPWAICAVLVRLSRCGAATAFRLHVHGFAAGEFLARRGVDYAKGRIYLPLEDLRRFGVSEDRTFAIRKILRPFAR